VLAGQLKQVGLVLFCQQSFLLVAVELVFQILQITLAPLAVQEEDRLMYQAELDQLTQVD
jgi:hypothetical protein